MEIVEFGGLRREQRAELEGDEDDPFDAAGSTLTYQPKERYVGIQDDRGRLVASTGMVGGAVKARALGPAFALLFCHEDRAGLYRKLGFAEIISEVVVKQPDGCAPMPDRTMWQALHSHATWPDGAAIVHS